MLGVYLGERRLGLPDLVSFLFCFRLFCFSLGRTKIARQDGGGGVRVVSGRGKGGFLFFFLLLGRRVGGVCLRESQGRVGWIRRWKRREREDRVGRKRATKAKVVIRSGEKAREEVGRTGRVVAWRQESWRALPGSPAGREARAEKVKGERARGRGLLLEPVFSRYAGEKTEPLFAFSSCWKMPA